MILYKADETDFSHLGLGVLTDVIEPDVPEERNGEFKLCRKYTTDAVALPWFWK